MAQLRSLLVVAPCLCALQSVSGDTAAANANCKNGATLYQDPASSIVGCYEFFSSPAIWTDADAYCQNTNCAQGFCGSLAAARTQGEHDFLTNLAGSGTRFWIAANSLSADHIWRWDGFGTTVNFNAPWVTVSDSNYASHPNQVILDGRASPYAWDYAQPNVSTHGYICRKDACPPGQDILGGICSGNAVTLQTTSGSSSSITWIAAPIVVGLVLILIILIIFLVWKYKNGTYNRLRRSLFFSSKNGSNAKDAARILELTEENQRLRAQLESLTGQAPVATAINPGYVGAGGAGPAGGASAAFVPPTLSAAAMPTVAGLPKIRRTTNLPLPPIDLNSGGGAGAASQDPHSSSPVFGASSYAPGAAAAAQSQVATSPLPGQTQPPYSKLTNSPKTERDLELGYGNNSPPQVFNSPSATASPYSPPSPVLGNGGGSAAAGAAGGLPNPSVFQRPMFGSNKVAPMPGAAPIFGLPRVPAPAMGTRPLQVPALPEEGGDSQA